MRRWSLIDSGGNNSGNHGQNGGAAAGISGWYALAYKSGAQAVANGPGDTPVTFELEVSDTPGIHDTSSATSRFTIPSAWNGRYGRLTYNLRHTGAEQGLASRMWKNGATFIGGARPDTQTTGNEYANGKGAIVPLATGDYYEVIMDDDCTIESDEPSWGCFELIRSSFQGALVSKSVDQALSAATNTDIVWATEAYDIGGWFDSGASATDLTVPSGVSLIRVTACILNSSVTDQLVLSMQKNGAAARGLPQIDSSTDGFDSVNGISAPLAVSAGDDFKVIGFSANACDIVANNETWFSIEELPSDLKYALVHRSSNQSLSGSNSWTIAQWNAEVADTSGFHDNSTNPSRLTVPSGSGITHAKCCFNFQTGSSIGGQIEARILKNGAVFRGMCWQGSETNGTDSVNGSTGIIEVSEGDYFEVEIFLEISGGTTLTSLETSWFSIEEVRDAA